MLTSFEPKDPVAEQGGLTGSLIGDETEHFVRRAGAIAFRAVTLRSRAAPEVEQRVLVEPPPRRQVELVQDEVEAACARRSEGGFGPSARMTRVTTGQQESGCVHDPTPFTRLGFFGDAALQASHGAFSHQPFPPSHGIRGERIQVRKNRVVVREVASARASDSTGRNGDRGELPSFQVLEQEQRRGRGLLRFSEPSRQVPILRSEPLRELRDQRSGGPLVVLFERRAVDGADLGGRRLLDPSPGRQCRIEAESARQGIAGGSCFGSRRRRRCFVLSGVNGDQPKQAESREGKSRCEANHGLKVAQFPPTRGRVPPPPRSRPQLAR